MLEDRFNGDQQKAGHTSYRRGKNGIKIMT